MDVSSADTSKENISQIKDLEKQLEFLNFTVKQENLEKELRQTKLEKESAVQQAKLEKELLQAKLEKESAAELAKQEKELLQAKFEKELLQAKLEKESAAELAKRDIQQLREKLFAAEGMMSARAIFEWILQRAWAEIMASKKVFPRFNASEACSHLERVGKVLRARVQFS